MTRLVIITEIISPYRIPLFNALADHGGVELHVIFLAETDPSLRQWLVYANEIRFSHQILRSWRHRLGKHNVLLNWGISRALKAYRPDVILCGGYNYFASWQSLLWARTHGVPFLLWSESTISDQRSDSPWVELLKQEFLRNCSAFVVPGISARNYLLAQGHKEHTIFTAPNAVDNDLFARSANAARQSAQYRDELHLPHRYFLFVGRLVWEKGVFDLLAAYAKLDAGLRKQIGLVFAGDGPDRHRLEEQAQSISPGVVRFSGFVHREQLAAYYGLADIFILPTHTDTWGLVVNEAMACGLPVIVSKAAGCAADLVCDQWNGWALERKNVTQLVNGMQSIGNQPDLCRTMGLRSLERIREYSPQIWCDGIIHAIRESRGN